MKYNKNDFIDIDVKKLIEWKDGNGEGCLVSNKITRDGWKVGYMYREEPDEGAPDSGWRFMKGDESDEYNEEPSNVNVFSINTICNYDPDIIKYLNSPVGTALIRISEHEFEIDKGDKPIYFAKQENIKMGKKRERMIEKINLDRICDNNEEENEKRQMEIYKKVIDEYNELCNVDFRKKNDFANNDYEVFDCLFQLTVAHPQVFDEFYEILKKYRFNDKTYLDYAIKKITKNASDVERFINGLIDIGIVDEVNELEDNSITLKSYLGEYNFFLADEYYALNQDVVSYIQNGKLDRNCHVNTLFLLKCLRKGEAITAKCSLMFDSSFYHSYYRCNGMVCDLNINCVMTEEEYNEIYDPKIISVVNIENLEEKQNNVKINCRSTLEDLLEIAVYEEILTEQI